jgi:hypothetical protein
LLFTPSDQDGDKLTPPPLRRVQRFNLNREEQENWKLLVDKLRVLLAQPPAEKIPPIVLLPLRPSAAFTGRNECLVRLHEGFYTPPRPDLTSGPVFALVGPAGCGKSALARHYAERFWRCYPQILWVDCRSNIPAQFALKTRLGVGTDPNSHRVLDPRSWRNRRMHAGGRPGGSESGEQYPGLDRRTLRLPACQLDR